MKSVLEDIKGLNGNYFGLALAMVIQPVLTYISEKNLSHKIWYKICSSRIIGPALVDILLRIIVLAISYLLINLFFKFIQK